MKKNTIAMAVAMVASVGGFIGTALPAENEMVKEEGRGRWTFSAGPAWRSNVKLSTSGRVRVPTVSASAAGTVSDKDPMNNTADWDNPLGETDISAISGIEGDRAYSTTATRTVTEVEAGSGVGFASSSDERGPLGLNLQAGYDFYQGENWSVGLNLKFAAFWGLESSSYGTVNGGTMTTRTYTDTYLFLNDPLAWEGAFDVKGGDAPEPSGVSRPTDVIRGTDPTSTTTTGSGVSAFSAKMRSDLYQIGLGPKVTWSAFEGWCEPLSWLDLYAWVHILFNFAYNRLEADGYSTSDTDFLIGFGGNVGFVGNITDWLGIYGQVGYEWIDKSDLSCGGFNGEVDYSSLVVSAGFQFRF